jgi:Raf kinase inhibitor-like YbhB/YbcL family protein
MDKTYTCLNEPTPTSPGLSWTPAPKGVASYAVIMHDPDFTRDKGTTDILLWMLWNIPGSATSIPEGMKEGIDMPDGTRQGKNVRNEHIYRGPCASVVSHHFTLELFALDQKLDLPPDASRPDLLKAMEGHVLGKAITIGMFHQ